MTDEGTPGVKNVRSEGTATVVSLTGDVDLNCSPEIHRVLVTVAGEEPARIVLDLADVAYMDSSGVGIIVEIFRRVQTYGGRLIVAAPNRHVRSLFHIPLNFGGVMRRNMQAIEAADARDPDNVVLSDENSLWGADVYIGASKEVPGARMERISGNFFTKVFEGPYSRAGQWAKEMTETLRAKGRTSSKMYFWYTTCPKCAKVYGKNYVVLVAQQ